jgi:hypothetical protein
MSHTDLGAEKTSLRKQVQNALIAEDRVSLSGSLGMFLRGLAWCFTAGLLLTIVLWWFVGGLSWIAWFGIFWLVLIPVLVWHETRNRKDYVLASLHEDRSEASTPEAADQSAAVRMIVWGPRQLMDGLAAVRGRRSGEHTARFKRAAQAVLELGKYSGGVEIKGIMHPPENMKVFMSALDWLDKHDYIGRSSDGERLWLSSIARKKLTDKGIILKITAV